MELTADAWEFTRVHHGQAWQMEMMFRPGHGMRDALGRRDGRSTPKGWEFLSQQLIQLVL